MGDAGSKRWYKRGEKEEFMKQQCKQQSENHHQNRPHSALRLLQPFSSQNTGPLAKCSGASLRFPRVLTPSGYLLWVEHVSALL